MNSNFFTASRPIDRTVSLKNKESAGKVELILQRGEGCATKAYGCRWMVQTKQATSKGAVVV